MTPKVKLSLISDSRDEKVYLLNPLLFGLNVVVTGCGERGRESEQE